MAGILDSDDTCNTHNALRNISNKYACGVTFSFKASADPPPDMHYAVVSLQECCAMADQPVLRIPGNTGCEMQFCALPEVTSSYTSTIITGYTTGPGTVVQTSPPSITEGSYSGWPLDVESCLRFVYKGDLPDSVEKDISGTDSWCLIRMYDDELSPSEEFAAVTASPAPPSWTSAAVDPWDAVFSSMSAASASASAHPTSTSNGQSSYTDRGTSSVRIWIVAALMVIGLVAAL